MFEEKQKGVGDPDAEKTVLGPLVDEAQFNRVTGFIQRGKEQNQGTLLTGGARIGDSGYFVEPTVFTDVKEDAEIHRDEIFGPVSVIRTFKTEEEVMKMSNDTEYGLMAGVFTQDINKVRSHYPVYSHILTSTTGDENSGSVRFWNGWYQLH